MSKKKNPKELQEKFEGIIPLKYMSVKNWLKYDKRNAWSKSIELYKYGKSKEFICNSLNVTMNDLTKWIDELYNPKKIQREVKNDWSISLRTPKNFSNWNSLILKQCWSKNVK